MKMRKYIFMTLKEMVNKRKLEDITVEDILTECDISRSTFYRHFNNKYQIAEWHYDYQFNVVKENNVGIVTIDDMISILFEDKELYRQAFNVQGNDSFKYFWCKYTYDYFDDRYRALNDEELAKNDGFTMRLYTEGSCTLMSQYINEPNEMTKEELVDYFTNAQPEFIKQLATC